MEKETNSKKKNPIHFILSKKKILNLIYLHLIFFFYSIISIFSKIASQYSFFSKEFFFYYAIMLFMLAIYSLIWQQIIKKFKISVAYSHKAVVLCWTLIWAVIIFKETITVNNLIGSIVIIFGIYIVNKGGFDE